MLRKIYRELVLIKKELQALRSNLEHIYKIDNKNLSDELKKAGVKISRD